MAICGDRQKNIVSVVFGSDQPGGRIMNPLIKSCDVFVILVGILNQDETIIALIRREMCKIT